MTRLVCTGFALSLVLAISVRERSEWQTRRPSWKSAAATLGSPISEIHPVFAVTETQVRAAFDAAEIRGEQQKGISVGKEQSINVIAQNPLGEKEQLKVRVVFLTPLDQVAQRGYSFGLVAKQRTPDDRKAYETLSIKTVLNSRDQAVFRVFLQQPKNTDALLPMIHFKLLNNNGESIDPVDEPTSFVALGKDLIGDTALILEGQPLTFPVVKNGFPMITSNMKKLTIRILISDEPLQLDFSLP